MNKKWFAFLIIWLIIFYLGFYFLYNKNKVEPKYCFKIDDKEVLVITNQDVETDTILKGPSKSFFELIAQKIKYKRTFISFYKSKILFEFNQEVTPIFLEKLFIKSNLRFNKKNFSYRLDNRWNCIFKENYVFFYKGKLTENESNLSFPSVKSDYSIYQLFDDKRIDVYLHNKQIKKRWQSSIQYSNVSDFELFAKYIPGNVEEYTFYEKKYAKDLMIFDDGSAFEKIIKNGFCIFKYKGKKYILVDIDITIDPFAILDEEIGRKELVTGLRKRYDHIFLTAETRKLNNSFFVNYLGDKLIFSDSESDFFKIQTLLKDREKKNYVSIVNQFLRFRNSKGLIYRNYTKLNYESRFYNNKQIYSLSFKNQVDFTEDEIKYSNIYDIKFIKGFDNQVFVFTSDELIKLVDGKEKNRIKIIGKLIGEPEILNDDKIELFFTTDEKLYSLNENLDENEGFPINLKNSPKIPFVRISNWKDNIIGFNENNTLSVCDNQGNVLKKATFTLKNINNSISCFKLGTWKGIIHNNQTAKVFDLLNPESFNTIDLPTVNTVFLTNNENQALFYIENNKLIRNDFNGDLKVCASGNNLGNIKVFSKFYILGVQSGSSLALFNSTGKCILKIKLPTKSINDYVITSNFVDEKYIILEDDLSKDIYIYTFEGGTISDGKISGNKNCFVRKIGSKFEIYSVVNNNLVRYIK